MLIRRTMSLNAFLEMQKHERLQDVETKLALDKLRSKRLGAKPFEDARSKR
jgi:hypothetical protein